MEKWGNGGIDGLLTYSRTEEVTPKIKIFNSSLETACESTELSLTAFGVAGFSFRQSQAWTATLTIIVNIHHAQWPQAVTFFGIHYQSFIASSVQSSSRLYLIHRQLSYSQ